MTGKTSFGHVASQIYGYFDDTEFLDIVDDEISANSIAAFIPALKPIIPDITEYNFSEKLTEKLCEIIRDEASSYRNKKGLGKIEFKTTDDKTNLGMITISIDIELINAIEKLLESPSKEIARLSLVSLRIDEKIDPKVDLLLSRKIKSYVSEYFSIMNEFFHDQDGNSKKSFEKLAVTMRVIFLECSEKAYKKDKIFDYIVDTIQKRTESNRIVAEAIVSYFVQDCEVFDEIS